MLLTDFMTSATLQVAILVFNFTRNPIKRNFTVQNYFPIFSNDGDKPTLIVA